MSSKVQLFEPFFLILQKSWSLNDSVPKARKNNTHSRSLTAASTVLRLRVSTEKPSSNFKRLVHIMMESHT